MDILLAWQPSSQARSTFCKPTAFSQPRRARGGIPGVTRSISRSLTRPPRTPTSSETAAMSAAAGTPAEGGGDRPWQSYHTAYTNAKAGTGALSPSVPLTLGVFRGFGSTPSLDQTLRHEFSPDVH